jgi:heat shock protein HslJ
MDIMKKVILALLFSSLLVAGCKSTQRIPALPLPPDPMETPEIQETYWKLTELMGKPVSLSENMKKEIHIIFKKEGKRVQGFSGCNTIMGKYELKEGNRITFTGMASTMMACPDLATESEFNKMLGTIDNYSINGNTMTLNRARMAPMARFEAVFMK